jgi:hypothetical protein
MDTFYPFIHQPEKKEFEPEPLYIELEPPIIQPLKKEEEASRVIIIELF